MTTAAVGVVAVARPVIKKYNWVSPEVYNAPVQSKIHGHCMADIQNLAADARGYKVDALLYMMADHCSGRFVELDTDLGRDCPSRIDCRGCSPAMKALEKLEGH
jgi:hypothetical protein